MIDPRDPAGFALVVVRQSGTAPDAAAVAARLGVAPAEMDAAFGVIALDPRAGLWCARVRAAALPDPNLAAPDIWVAADTPIAPLQE